MRNLLFYHEYSDGQFWYDEQTCIEDFFEHLDRGQIFETICCFHDVYELIQHGLDEDTNWFQEIYEDAVNHCISEYVFDGLYTDKEIEYFIIMDEKKNKKGA